MSSAPVTPVSPVSEITKDITWVKGHIILALVTIAVLAGIIIGGITLFQNMIDLGGKHDQLVVRSPSQLRHPHAAFNPKFRESSNLLAAGGSGPPLGVPMLVQDQDLEGEEQ